MGHVNVVETLIKHGANFNCIEIDGWTPLHFCNYQNKYILINLNYFIS